jgi:1,3-beta-glucan synthase
MKQTKLRRRRVVRYAILYFVLLVVFLALIVGPIVAGKYVPASLFKMLDSTNLVQPTGLDNNDTRGKTPTGTGSPSYSGIWTSSSESSRATATSGSDKRALYI